LGYNFESAVNNTAMSPHLLGVAGFAAATDYSDFATVSFAAIAEYFICIVAR
jgi:hypothetical protein